MSISPAFRGSIVALVVLLNGAIALRTLWYEAPFGRDLPQFYAAGKLVQSGQAERLYDRSAYTFDLPAKVSASNRYSLYFNRPAFAALPLFPVAFLPYKVFEILAALLNCGFLAVLVWILPRWFPGMTYARIWLFAFLPFVWSIEVGQDTLLITLFLAYGIRLLQRQEHIKGGAALALAVVKPHLVWAVPLALAIQRKWRALGAFLAVGFTLALISFAIVGVNGFRQWAELLSARTTDTVPRLMGTIRALWINEGPVVGVVIGASAFVAFLVISRRHSVDIAISAALFVGPMLNIHAYRQDYAPVAIAALLCPYDPLRYLILVPWAYFAGGALGFVWMGFAFLLFLAFERGSRKDPNLRPVVSGWRGGSGHTTHQADAQLR